MNYQETVPTVDQLMNRAQLLTEEEKRELMQFIDRCSDVTQEHFFAPIS